ncbi:ParM/StbA family protein (plasmid) [Agrobacterium rosae]|uniref:ParM/StbA family protein n=1 Tax=Agrobacterium rosae TaxID=1972867 RepID=A0AAW9FKV4_9HYPH|nr:MULTISPECIES: ParM/StbA family protein [Agrobacterium]MCF1501558.1 ParM/StbA family protein [Allorhizobium sp. Av2]MDX8321724.1 ParM/StbA family protein [Agrobacterium sp. rho-8.1]MDX8305187.1 ParM/StbA family protein [Agrobacterium rosae]MDX8311470.1 ParM/StbA family protein [Agrobacterium sp. rho-13.3]MDX8316297.1 ParM/StbA family protein [Agrobacterium rosae]
MASAEKKVAAPLEEPQIEILVAIDDGHSEIKVAYFENGTSGPIKNFSFPSRTIRGWEEMDATGAAPPDAYFAFDVANANPADLAQASPMLVVNRGRSGSDNENRTHDYPTSDRNRVLVNHALHTIAAGRNVSFTLATALPYSDFHMPASGKHNVELIAKKKENIAKSVMAIEPRTLKPKTTTYSIDDQAVFSEGVATFFDCMMGYDGSSVQSNKEFAARFEHSTSYAVIDIGGKTTDIVFGSWSGNFADQTMIKTKASTSLKEGTLDAADQLGELIKQKLELRRVSDPEKALFNKQISVFGELHDVSAEADIVLDALYLKIREPLLRHLEDASDLAYVIFVGGGSMLLKEKIRTLFNPSVVLIPAQPQFANANGMLKVMKMLHAAKAPRR